MSDLHCELGGGGNISTPLLGRESNYSCTSEEVIFVVYQDFIQRGMCFYFN